MTKLGIRILSEYFLREFNEIFSINAAIEVHLTVVACHYGFLRISYRSVICKRIPINNSHSHKKRYTMATAGRSFQEDYGNNYAGQSVFIQGLNYYTPANDVCGEGGVSLLVCLSVGLLEIVSSLHLLNRSTDFQIAWHKCLP